MDKRLLPHHIEDLHRSGLTDKTIAELGFYSGTAAELRAILSFDAEPALVILHPCAGEAKPNFI